MWNRRGPPGRSRIGPADDVLVGQHDSSGPTFTTVGPLREGAYTWHTNMVLSGQNVEQTRSSRPVENMPNDGVMVRQHDSSGPTFTTVGPLREGAYTWHTNMVLSGQNVEQTRSTRPVENMPNDGVMVGQHDSSGPTFTTVGPLREGAYTWRANMVLSGQNVEQTRSSRPVENRPTR